MTNPDDPMKAFLSQPPEHGFNDEEEETVATQLAPHRSFMRWLKEFLFDKKPSGYSSIAPRKADGTRTGPFFFNGNGRGR